MNKYFLNANFLSSTHLSTLHSPSLCIGDWVKIKRSSISLAKQITSGRKSESTTIYTPNHQYIYHLNKHWVTVKFSSMFVTLDYPVILILFSEQYRFAWFIKLAASFSAPLLSVLSRFLSALCTCVAALLVSFQLTHLCTDSVKSPEILIYSYMYLV